jgi:hypothetical protein
MEIEVKTIGLENADLESELIKYLSDLAEDIPKAYREVTDESTPRGRQYRTGIITARRTKALESLGLRNRGKTRSVTGTRIHRAAAADQPAARMTGKLTRKIRVVKRGKLARAVSFDTPYAGFVLASRPVGFEIALDRAIERTAFGE